jgi:hypothetical protein
MKKIYLKTLENYIAYANGYNQSKHYDVLLWTKSQKTSLRRKLIADLGVGVSESLCLIFDEMLEFENYEAHDFVIMHRYTFELFVDRMNKYINERH